MDSVTDTSPAPFLHSTSFVSLSAPRDWLGLPTRADPSSYQERRRPDADTSVCAPALELDGPTPESA